MGNTIENHINRRNWQTIWWGSECFLDPHASRVPILGRDVLDNFAVIFDREKDQIILMEHLDNYKIIKD